jgi:hypothetical protein
MPSPDPTSAKLNSKRTGEISEAAFLHKAVSLSFKVTKPWGDSERYDFILDSGARLWRVQIKSTSALHAGGYQIQPIHYVYGERKLAYTSDEIDALAAHIVPLDVWYILPVSALGCGTSLRLFPHGECKTARFEHFREAWHLFRETQPGEPTPAEPTPADPAPSPAPLADDNAWVQIETPIPHWKPRFPPIFARHLAGRKK